MRFSNLSRQYTAVWRQTNAIYDAWAKRHGLTYPELLAVLSLSAPGPAPRPEEIAETWLLSPAVRTHHFARLCQARLAHAGTLPGGP